MKAPEALKMLVVLKLLLHCELAGISDKMLYSLKVCVHGYNGSSMYKSLPTELASVQI